jgi:hypothetical protein
MKALAFAADAELIFMGFQCPFRHLIDPAVVRHRVAERWMQHSEAHYRAKHKCCDKNSRPSSKRHRPPPRLSKSPLNRQVLGAVEPVTTGHQGKRTLFRANPSLRSVS